MKKLDLEGLRFGSVVVVSLADNVGQKRAWNVLCDCGNMAIITTDHLRSGHTKTCGCRTGMPRNVRAEARLKDIYTRNANDRNLEFNLTDEDFLSMVFSPCFYCGTTESNYDTRYDIKYNGIDRLDNSLGYVAGNCVPCCSECNYMKGTMNFKEFLEAVQRIAKWNF